ncbi:MAG: AI-2E family transporter [Planctomyces sp.]
MLIPISTAEGRWWQAFILALWGVIVVGTIDNLLRPVLVGRRLQLPTVLAFISVVGGIAVFGSSGLILGPVALTVTMVLLEIWPHRILVKDLPSMDSNAIDRFVNEGGPPAAIFDSSGNN